MRKLVILAGMSLLFIAQAPSAKSLCPIPTNLKGKSCQVFVTHWFKEHKTCDDKLRKSCLQVVCGNYEHKGCGVRTLVHNSCAKESPSNTECQEICNKTPPCK